MIKMLIKKYYWYILGIVLFVAAETFFNLQLPDYMSKIVANGIALLDLKYVKNTGLIMVLFAVVSMICSVIGAFITSKFGATVTKDLRKDVYEKVMYMDDNEFNNFETSSLITRTTNDINRIQMFASSFFKMIFFSFFMGAGAIFKALGKTSGMSSLTLVILGAVAFIVFLLIILYFTVVPKFEKIQKLTDKINNKLREILNGILVIRSLNKEKHEEKEFDKINDEYSKLDLFISRVMSFLSPILNFLMNGVTILIVLIVALEATNIAEIGNMMAFMQYALEILMSFLMFSLIFVLLPRANVSYKRIDEILSTKKSIINVENATKKSSKLQGNVEFKNVSFKYSNAESEVINNISFKTPKGTTTAIIGGTGSGKSTLINLLPRLFDVTNGEILIDGNNIISYDLEYLRDNISFAPQKGILFSGTIKSNLKDGKKDATDADLMKAAKASQAYEFIKKKKEGFDYEISQNATNVSGGQKQRLSIARALIKDGPILIFDDTFSALDFKTDATLRKEIRKNYKDKTIFIVAQRIGTIMNADQIIVLDKGKIVGIGKHDELLKKCSIYKEIATSQLGKEAL